MRKKLMLILACALFIPVIDARAAEEPKCPDGFKLDKHHEQGPECIMAPTGGNPCETKHHKVPNVHYSMTKHECQVCPDGYAFSWTENKCTSTPK
jgi:hypothetical protein